MKSKNAINLCEFFGGFFTTYPYLNNKETLNIKITKVDERIKVSVGACDCEFLQSDILKEFEESIKNTSEVFH
jgi:hypothetical protein